MKVSNFENVRRAATAVAAPFKSIKNIFITYDAVAVHHDFGIQSKWSCDAHTHTHIHTRALDVDTLGVVWLTLATAARRSRCYIRTELSLLVIAFFFLLFMRHDSM